MQIIRFFQILICTFKVVMRNDTFLVSFGIGHFAYACVGNCTFRARVTNTLSSLNPFFSETKPLPSGYWETADAVPGRCLLSHINRIHESFRRAPTPLLLRKKAKCDADALKIVEKMLDSNIKEDWLLQNVTTLYPNKKYKSNSIFVY